jgi:hypothetical protein
LKRDATRPGRKKPLSAEVAHLVKKFKLSNDKKFAEKVQDVVGLYLNPPDKALVLCVDEKSQIQALDRVVDMTLHHKPPAGGFSSCAAQMRCTADGLIATTLASLRARNRACRSRKGGPAR